MKLLINLCAQDGIVSHNSGVGTMVKRYIQALESCLKNKGIEYFINLITPQYNENGFGFSYETKKQNKSLLNAKIFEVSNGTNGTKFFGAHSNWIELCKNTAQILNSINYKNFDIVISLLNDTPFAGVMELCKYYSNHKMIWIPHSTAKIHQISDSCINDKNFQQRLNWELNAVQYINNHKNCYLGVVGQFVKNHMINEYGLKNTKILNINNGELLHQTNIESRASQNLFSKMDKSEDIIISFGRPEKYKNLDATMKIAHLLNIRCIIITQEYFSNMSYVNYLKSLAKDTKTELYVNVAFDFPHYILKHYPKKIIFILPSIKETSGLEINEIRKLNKENILLVSNNIEALKEQIDDGINGILIDIDNIENSASRILKYFNDDDMKIMAHNSYQKLNNCFDFEKTMSKFLKKLLKPYY